MFEGQKKLPFEHIHRNESAPHYVFNVLLSKVLQKLLFRFVPRLSAKFKASLPAGVMRR